MKQIVISILVLIIVAVVIFGFRARTNNRSAVTTPSIPEGVTQEEHESHHTDQPNN